ncbi:DUF169 domain-containing protein [Anaerovorax odorimutans]|uniref:DUF169 domain-containing protein n=1 Tax=Anaerovorax odorimutans TaxID=109327 RepID=A0ABT1RQQ4_9FIRM|nr:DUF169 domain-containing protein [Anaerovorax odorimutans]MCQ4637226.1 DUF169 domain-containing protein [Anaerovorax odorimutans]
MKSKIAQYIKLSTEPVAVIKTDACPQGALQFKEGTWGCVIALLNEAAKGKTAALSEKTTGCPGGKAGVGFKPFEPGTIEYFLSVGGKGSKEGEFYKESPDLALSYIEQLPEISPKEYLVLKPVSRITKNDDVQSVVFLVNADQLSGLVTLANYDQAEQDSVRIKFGAGCAQSLLYTMADSELDNNICMIGLTDPSARKCIDKDILSFSIPYRRYLEMERKADDSFLSKKTWQLIAKRI